jgi:hypothetical protein
MKTLPERITYSAEAAQAFMFEGLGNAMTKYNK